MWITRLQPFYGIDRQWTQWEPEFKQLTPLWSNFFKVLGLVLSCTKLRMR